MSIPNEAVLRPSRPLLIRRAGSVVGRRRGQREHGHRAQQEAAHAEHAGPRRVGEYQQPGPGPQSE